MSASAGPGDHPGGDTGNATVSATIDEQGGRVLIGGTIDFDNAARLLEQVRQTILDAPTVTIDLGDVQRSNSAGLALMIEWLAVARASGHSVTYERVPDGLRQIARVCQVEAMLPV